MRRVLFALSLLMVACTKKTPPPAPVDAEAPKPIVADARDIAEKACLSCHTMQMLQQQRLTEAQWNKVVTKMVGWGANLEPNDTAPLVAWLVANYDLDAGKYDFPPVDAPVAEHALDPTPDGAYAGGDAERGRALYTDRCSGCHGPDARGHIGTNLVDRPFLYRAEDFAKTIRKGRGKMPPAKPTDAEVADTLAYLRTLR